MFLVLRAELVIAQTGITSARQAAVFSYVGDRLKEGEEADANRLFEVFDRAIVKDLSATAVFYARCDRELLHNAGVAVGLGGMWVDTLTEGKKNSYDIYYRVQSLIPFLSAEKRYYSIHLVARNWIGEGKLKKEKKEEEKTEDKTVYLAENATVYHLYKNCHYINIKPRSVAVTLLSGERNDSGARYYPCEFCKPTLPPGTYVFITKFGTRYHAVSTCSAIERNPKEVSLSEVKDKLPVCSKCEKNAAKEEQK